MVLLCEIRTTEQILAVVTAPPTAVIFHPDSLQLMSHGPRPGWELCTYPAQPYWHVVTEMVKPSLVRRLFIELPGALTE
jgi:hypothetical protein